MPKAAATISLVSHTPDHGDGTIRMNDTVTFAISPPDAGTISILGYEVEGANSLLVYSVGLTRGVLSCQLGPSMAWTSGPLHCSVLLRELVHNNVQTIAETSFGVAG